jgi:hypothetical protein
VVARSSGIKARTSHICERRAQINEILATSTMLYICRFPMLHGFFTWFKLVCLLLQTHEHVFWMFAANICIGIFSSDVENFGLSCCIHVLTFCVNFVVANEMCCD